MVLTNVYDNPIPAGTADDWLAIMPAGLPMSEEENMKWSTRIQWAIDEERQARLRFEAVGTLQDMLSAEEYIQMHDRAEAGVEKASRNRRSAELLQAIVDGEIQITDADWARALQVAEDQCVAFQDELKDNQVDY